LPFHFAPGPHFISTLSMPRLSVVDPGMESGVPSPPGTKFGSLSYVISTWPLGPRPSLYA
jgi:hypothetical protein